MCSRTLRGIVNHVTAERGWAGAGVMGRTWRGGTGRAFKKVHRLPRQPTPEVDRRAYDFGGSDGGGVIAIIAPCDGNLFSRESDDGGKRKEREEKKKKSIERVYTTLPENCRQGLYLQRAGLIKIVF